MYKGGFGGGFGGGNLQELMKQAQKMQADITRIKTEIENADYTASVGGGMVTCTVSGKRQLKSILIKPEVVDPDDKEMLEDLVIAAVNDALSQVDKAESERLPNLPAGM